MMTDKVGDRLNTFIEKMAVWFLAAIVSMTVFMYQETRTKVENLEKNVSTLQQEKVSKAELREELDRLRTQNEANKSDIIARIDLYFNHVAPALARTR
jgi:hypothetical protein